MKFLGNNVDGITNKLESLEHIINTEKPGAVFLQETKVGRTGRIKVPSNLKYTWYELIRTKEAEKGMKGGGLAIGILNTLEPSWISEGDNDAEALTVEIWVGGFPLRLVCGYGPQEGDSKERKVKYWDYLNQEVHNARENGAGIVIQMDGNLWAGDDIIKGDPKQQNQNGKMFQDFLSKNLDLTVANALPDCEGKITRRRHMKNGTQESILDFFVVCDQVLPLVTKMKVHEEDEIAFVRYAKKVVKSDHKVLELNVDLKIHMEAKHERQEIFNLRNKTKQKLFYEFTSKIGRFTKCVSSCEESVEVQFRRWKRMLNKSIHACFNKIRLTKNKEDSNLDKLLNEKKEILKKKNKTEEDERKVKDIEQELTDEIADKELEKLITVTGELDSEPNKNIWREMRKTYPKKTNPIPTGVKNFEGKVITNPNERKKVTLEHFHQRMRKRKVKFDVEEEIKLNEDVFSKRVEEAETNQSAPFSMEELEKVTTKLKSGKSKDPNNLIYELFKDGVMGNDMKHSLLMLLNKMKTQMSIPDELKTAHITILHKKNSKLDLKNWRGIFVTSVVRGILMKLIYERTYEIVDKSMTDSQIGARKKKSVRNHLFVLNSILSDVISSKNKKPIDLNIMDFKQMFDAEELPQVLNAMYESGVKNDMLALLNEANKTVKFAVKTPSGITEQRTIINKVMQGDVMAPIMSSNFVDTNIVKPAERTGNVYMYKNKVPIPPLVMQDDTLTVSLCGKKTKEMNNLLNTCTSSMGLQFGSDKCVKMHVGKSHIYNCENGEVDSWEETLVTNTDKSKIVEDVYKGRVNMKNVKVKKYLGEIISTTVKNETNIKEKTNKAFGNVKKIEDTLNERPYGKHRFKAALLMRNSMLLGSLANNIETMINVTKKDVENLEKPDICLQEKVLPTKVKASKAFRYLELGIVPIRFVVMQKRLLFLKYILNEDPESMLGQVYKQLKIDSRKGDFVSLIKQDMKEMEIHMEDCEVNEMSINKWKKLVKDKTKSIALKYLVTENSKKEKTKHIQFTTLKLSDYLKLNKNKELSEIIFGLRSGTLDLKAWNRWKYEDNLCVLCEKKEENINHFMECVEYGEPIETTTWKEVYENNAETQIKIAKEVKLRLEKRDKILKAGLDYPPGSNAPTVVVE